MKNKDTRTVSEEEIYLNANCEKCDYDANPVVMGGNLHYRSSDGMNCICDEDNQTLEEELKNCRFDSFDLDNYLINHDSGGDGWFLSDCDELLRNKIENIIKKYHPNYFKNEQ